MKKILLLALVMLSGVVTANATDYIISGNRAIVNGNHNSDFWWQDADNQLTETTSSGIYTLVVEGCSLTANSNYGFKVKVNENAWNDATTFPASEYQINVPYTGTYTIIYYVDIANKGIRVIATPMLRWSLGNSGNGNWDWLYDSGAFFTKKGDFEWTFEVNSNDFTSDFSFRLYLSIFQKSAYPGSQDLVLSYGDIASTSAYFNKAESTDYSWKLVKPTYDFEKAVITAIYNPFANNDAGTWDVTADAYVSVTTNGSGFATYVSPAPLTISGGATAFYATDNGNGTASATAITNPVANTPMLIKGDNGTSYSFAVAASGTDNPASNAFKAGTDAAVASEVSGLYNYILNGDTFYKAAGQTVAVGKAYLQLSKEANTANARILIFPDDDETQGISAASTVKSGDAAYYNLSGQRVNAPSKGLFIRDGKKVIIK